MPTLMSNERMMTGGLHKSERKDGLLGGLGGTHGQGCVCQQVSSSSCLPAVLQWIHLLCTQTTRQRKSGGSW